MSPYLIHTYIVGNETAEKKAGKKAKKVKIKKPAYLGMFAIFVF